MGCKGRLVSLLVFGIVASSSQACLLLSAFARPQVALVAKSNMLIWNPESKTEHLVQSLALLSKINQFDYLVPTPTKPTVSLVGQGAFKSAYEDLHPRKVSFEDFTDLPSKRSGQEATESKEEAYVKNIKVKTIYAGDILALSKWMEESGYHPNEKQRAWLQRYVDRHWYLTAFTVKPTEELSKTEAVRLTFKTENPILPYFSAGANWLDKVRQELYLVSPTPLTGVIGKKAVWKGQSNSHTYLTTTASGKLAGLLKIKTNEMPSQSWVNWYVENGSIADTTDDIVFQVPAKKPVTKPKHVRQPH